MHELSRAWVNRGAKVTVVTGFPNYPTGQIPATYAGKLVAEECVDGIRVLRSWLYARPTRGVANRGANHLSFAAACVPLSLPRLRSVDVVLASSPPLFTAFSAWLMARVRSVPFVLEVRDLWPDAFVELGVMRDGPALRLVQRLARFLYAVADRIVVVTEGFRERLIGQGVPARKIAVITNGADTRTFSPDADGRPTRERFGLGGDFVAAYVGGHGVSQALETVIEAASRQPDVTYLLVGDGAEREKIAADVSRRGLRNVRMHRSVAKSEVPGLYAAADVCLVPLRDIGIFETFIPSKMFEALATGRPIVGALRGEARAILERSGGAIIVDPEDGPALSQAVGRLKQDAALRAEMGRRGRAFVLEHYDRDQLAGRYLDLLREVTRR